MNSSLLDYILWRGDLSFEQCEFGEIDASILAHLAYEHIEGLVSSSFSQGITLADLAENFKKTANLRERTSMGYGINPKTPEILYKCGESRRFGGIKVCGLCENLSEEKNEQFAAMTFVIDKTAVIVFRGTDDTVTGWCEDLLLAKNPVLPSHTDGLNYFNKAAAFFKKNLIILGHSKGGTVAVYCAVKTSAAVQKRILAVYNMDGPGWPKDFYKTDEYKKVENRILSVYPESDIVGKVFYPTAKYKIIKSDGVGIQQHDMLNWHCEGNFLCEAEDYTEDSKIFFKSVNEWYENVSEPSRQRFIDTLIEIYRASGYKNNFDLMNNKINATKNMLAEYNKLDKETKAVVKKVLSTLGKVLVSELPIFNFFREDFIKLSAKKGVEKIAQIVKEIKMQGTENLPDSENSKLCLPDNTNNDDEKSSQNNCGE